MSGGRSGTASPTSPHALRVGCGPGAREAAPTSPQRSRVAFSQDTREAAPSPSGGGLPPSLPGISEKVQVWSKSSGEWRDAVVMKHVPNKTATVTRITVQYEIPGLGIAQKTLLPTSLNFRRLVPSSRMLATKTYGDSLAATGWASFRPDSTLEDDEDEVVEASRRQLLNAKRDHRGARATAAKPGGAAGQPRPSRQPDALPAAPSEDDPSEELPDGDVLGDGRFLLQHQLGSGSFSTVRLAQDLQTGGEVALKLEPARTKLPQLIEEARRYKLLAGGAGIPQLYWYGTDLGYNIMALELLGPSLDVAFERCDRRFGVETVVRVSTQMLSAVEFLHSKGFVHRDLKPQNFCLGHIAEKRGKVYILDFGLAKRYRSPKSMGGGHIRFRADMPFVGTVRYASIAAHLGEEQGRCDDLQALGYIFLYFLNGSLPWQGAAGHSKADRRQQVLDIKQAIGTAELFASAPPQFAAFFEYARSLSFDACPDYERLQGLLGAVEFAGAGESPSRRRANGSGDVLADLLDSASTVSGMR